MWLSKGRRNMTLRRECVPEDASMLKSTGSRIGTINNKGVSGSR
jgi:hypothetical protein